MTLTMNYRWLCLSFVQRKSFLFLCSSLTGMLFAFVLLKYEDSVTTDFAITHFAVTGPNNNFEKLYEEWLRGEGYVRKLDYFYDDKIKDTDLEREDNFLRDRISVLCIILTKDIKRARAIKRTWSQHCDESVFYGTYNDEVIPVSKLPNTSPWPLLCGGLLRAWVNFNQIFHWVIVVDDRTYVIVENLRYMVAPLKNSTNLFYLGHPVKDIQSDYVYNLGRAGIALNQIAMATFVENVPDDDACDALNSECSNEDCILGKLMHQFGASPVDTRDQYGRGRFNGFAVGELLLPRRSMKYHKFLRSSLYISDRGQDCCSDYAVTFHDVPPSKMQLLEYTVYRLRPIAQSSSTNIEIQNIENSSVKKV